jgi:hypothetical protein
MFPSRTFPEFIVPIGSYIYRITVPKGSNPRDTYPLTFPIEAIERQIKGIAAFPPAFEDIQDFRPVIVGDSQLGMALQLETFKKIDQELLIKTTARDTGWILIPLPENFAIVQILKLNGKSEPLKLGEFRDYTINTVDHHTLVVLKIERGTDSYIVQFTSPVEALR